MTTSPRCQPVEIRVAPAFQRDFKAFSKNHHSLDDLIVEALTDEIGPDPTCGWGYQRWGNRVRKLRVADKCHGIGKSKGFRLVYDWNPDTRVLWLLRLFTHAQMSDLADKEIRKIRNEAGVD